MSLAIEVRALCKSYGRTLALDDAHLEVEEGSVFGFLGPNGAGKTTTLRILTGLARPTSGEATVFGNDVVSSSARVRSEIGFLPDVPGYYTWMTASEYLRFSGRLFGIGGQTLDNRVSTLLDMAGLTDVRQRIGGYSRGMKQRLGIAQALISAPRLLLLDEPTSALDPMGRKDVLDMIAALKGRTTVFFSTHILSDVERVCDTVAILDKGHVVRQAPMHDLKHDGAAPRVLVEVGSNAEELTGRFSSSPWAIECERQGNRIRCTIADIDRARHEIPAIIADADVALVRLEEEEPTLEDVFVTLVGGGA